MTSAEKPSPRPDLTCAEKPPPRTFSWGRIDASASEVSPEYRYSFISSGYRVHLRPRQAFLSAFRLHNESLNVWTHIFGFSLFVALAWHVIRMEPNGSPDAQGLRELFTERLTVLRAAARSCVDEQWHAFHPEFDASDALKAVRHRLNASLVVNASLIGSATLSRVLGARQQLVHDMRETMRQVSERLNSTHALGDSMPSAAALAARLHLSMQTIELPRVQLPQEWPKVQLPQEWPKVQLPQLPMLQLPELSELALPQMFAPMAAAGTVLAPPSAATSSGAAAPPQCASTGGSDAVRAATATAATRRLDALLGDSLRLLETALPELRQRCEGVERWPLYVFVASALVCLSASVTYHLFGTANERWASTFCSLDFTGIVCLIVGSTVPCIYYGFHGSYVHQAVYLGSIGFFGGLLLLCTMLPFFYREAWRITRIALFIVLGALGAVPLVHCLFWHSFSTHITDLWAKVGLSCALYLLGAYIYAKRFPECLWPRLMVGPAFFGASHQLWHLFVVAAAYVHFVAVVELWDNVANSTAMAI